MDWMTIREKLAKGLKTYQYGLLILALGLVLMWLPESKPEEAEEPAETLAMDSADPARQLEQILSQIDGAGAVRVMLSEASGGETLYQTDEDHSGDSVRRDTVILTGGDRAQMGLVRQVNPPVYQGAIVVCQGADRAAVRLAVVEAVSDVTGLGADRISVLKMK